MKSVIAILTYRRCKALQAMLEGITKHCAHYSCLIMEDCGQRDNTADFLQAGRLPTDRPELMAKEWETDFNQSPLTANYPNARVFLADQNLGVAGNSNRALKVFMDGDWDHLCLCNDDLFVEGDFVDVYARAHQELGVGLFCFCDFTQKSPAISGHPDTYRWATYPVRGWKVKFLPRFTGIMMSVTRATVEKAGYFDASFTQFGEEHSDWTIRCRLVGGIRLDNQDMHCLDVEHSALRHQDVESSVQGADRKRADQEAAVIMQAASQSYGSRNPYRPFRLKLPVMAGGYRGGGIPVNRLLDCGYELVTSLV